MTSFSIIKHAINLSMLVFRSFSIFIFFLLSQNSMAFDGALCALPTANKVQKVIRNEIKPMAYDKYVHCSVSCAVSLKCGKPSTALLGLAKEVWDVFGSGNVELADLAANYHGMKIGDNKSISSLYGCKKACGRLFRSPKI